MGHELHSSSLNVLRSNTPGDDLDHVAPTLVSAVRSYTREEPHVMGDRTPLIFPDIVTSGQWGAGSILHACPLTEVKSRLLTSPSNTNVHVFAFAEGGSTGAAGRLGINEAHNFGESRCRKSAGGWANIQQDDITSRTVIQFFCQGIRTLTKEQEKSISPEVDLKELRTLWKAGELLELPNGAKVLVRKVAEEPSGQEDRIPGKF